MVLLSVPESRAIDGRYEGQARLLHGWRTRVAMVSQAAVAAGLGVSEPLVSMWETGDRRISLDHLRQLDRFHRAGGALLDLALALDSPCALPPRTEWAHNPQGPSGPRWAWIRPRPGRRRVDALLLWGAFAFDCSADCDERGFFVTSPVSMPNPPVWVHLREPGWVDFGRGAIPDTSEVPTFPALSAARVASGGQSPAGLVAPEIVDRFRRDPVFADAVVDFFGQRPDLIREVFRATDPRTYVTDLTTDPPRPPRSPSSPRPFDGRRYRALREARGLSQADAAQLATELLPRHPVSDDQVRLLERGGRPRPPLLRSRLDRVYRADGHTCREEVPVRGSRSPFVVDFPAYWIGPVWVTLLADDPAARRLQLTFGTHVKQVVARPSTTLTCRRAIPDKEPLQLFCPAGWWARAGVGWHPEARDVNWGWRNVDDVSTRGDAPVHELFLNLFGRTGAQFDELLHRLDPAAGR